MLRWTASSGKHCGFHGIQTLKLSFLSHPKNHLQLQWYKMHWGGQAGILPSIQERFQNDWLAQNLKKKKQKNSGDKHPLN